MLFVKNSTCNIANSDKKQNKMGLDATKPVFGVSDKVRLKPVSSATEANWNIEILHEASLDIIIYNKRITKALISLFVIVTYKVKT